MLSKWFNQKKTLPTAVPPAAAPVVHDRYEYMSNDEARATMLTAVLEDDLGVVKSIARHHPGCIDWMIEAKGTSIGGTPMTTPLLVYAAGKGSLRVLQWMIDNGVKLEERSNILNQTALYHASERGERKAVEILLLAGADPETRAEVHIPITAVQAARNEGHEDIARLLENQKQDKERKKTVPTDTQDSLSLRDDRVLTAPRVSFKVSAPK